MATFVSRSTMFFVAHSHTHSNTDGSELPQKVQKEAACRPPAPLLSHSQPPVSVCVSDIPVQM